MAMGILAVFDMAGIDVGVNVHKANAAQYPPDPTYYQADFALYEAGRLGQKSGKGYYRYEPGNRARIDDPESARDPARARAAAAASAARAHRSRRSSSAACIRCSMRACAFSKKASRCALPTSMSSGLPVTAFRATEAGRCSTRTPSA